MRSGSILAGALLALILLWIWFAPVEPAGPPSVGETPAPEITASEAQAPPPAPDDRLATMPGAAETELQAATGAGEGEPALPDAASSPSDPHEPEPDGAEGLPAPEEEAFGEGAAVDAGEPIEEASAEEAIPAPSGSADAPVEAPVDTPVESTPPVVAQSGSDSATSDAVQALAAIVGRDAFHAGFHQVTTSALGNELRSSTGEVWIRRPDHFRWSAETPFAELLVGDGERIWLWDPDLEQATVRRYDDRLEGTPVQLLSGGVDVLREQFEIRRLEYRADGAQRWQLSPRARGSLYAEIELIAMDGVPTVLVILDDLGQRTEVRFLDPHLPESLPNSLFRFEPPAGADVIREDLAEATDVDAGT